ncbi:MAG: Hpt domain-containing protein [gamma proteobacterium symbiont of Taylorina sp.]|nr:Hpt domain-containing protein [gamma proteobacterium symbiont of Taylorina sp.]
MKILPVLDLTKALDVSSNNRSLADDLLAMLIKAIPEYNMEIDNQRGNRKELKLIIHKIYGALRYLGAPALSAIIGEINNDLFELSDEQLDDKIGNVFIEFDRLLKEEKYTNY